MLRLNTAGVISWPDDLIGLRSRPLPHPSTSLVES